MGQLPGLLAERARQSAELDGLGARGGPIDGALGDALHDRGQPEKTVDYIELPVRSPAVVGAGAIGCDVFVLSRDAQCR